MLVAPSMRLVVVAAPAQHAVLVVELDASIACRMRRMQKQCDCKRPLPIASCLAPWPGVMQGAVLGRFQPRRGAWRGKQGADAPTPVRRSEPPSYSPVHSFTPKKFSCEAMDMMTSSGMSWPAATAGAQLCVWTDPGRRRRIPTAVVQSWRRAWE